MDVIKNYVIQNIITEPKTLMSVKKSLSSYSFIHNICELKIGSHIRWIDLNKFPYNLQGVVNVVNISIEDTHITITCKSFTNKFFKKKYDDLVIFKKNTSI
jgi:hypothetical protein